MKEKPRNRFSPGAEDPWIINEKQNHKIVEPLKRGWPAENEPVTYAWLSLAISHRKRDIIARYLRQLNAQLNDLGLSRIAGLFDSAKDGTEADRLQFTKRSNSHPVAKQRTARHRYQIGYEISQLMLGDMTYEDAVETTRLKYGLKETATKNAYAHFKKQSKNFSSAVD